MAVAAKFGRTRAAAWGFGGVFGCYQRSWLFLTVLVGAEIAVATYLADRNFGISPVELFVEKIRWAVLPAWLIIPLGWLGMAAIQMARRATPSPSLTLLRLIRYRKKWIIRGAILFAFYLPAAQAYAVLKSSIPKIIEFYADPYLISLDIWVLGDDAWKISHGIFPSSSIYFFDRVYILWFSYVILLAGWFCFSRNEHTQIRGTLALNLCWVLLGGLTATLTASVGPCFHGLFFASSHFDELIATLDAADRDRGLLARYAMSFLLENHNTGRFGAGISAMPSLHVSMAFLGFLATWNYARSVWPKIVTGSFTVLILIGSIHLGWHYLSDGLVSILATAAIWRLAAMIVARLDSHRGEVQPSIPREGGMWPKASTKRGTAPR